MKRKINSGSKKNWGLAQSIIVFFTLIAFLFSCSSCVKNTTSPKTKTDPYLEYMKSIQPATKEDINTAKRMIQELEDKYGVEFVMLGIARPLRESTWGLTKKTGVLLVYAYSVEYPEVYITKYVHDGLDRYLESVEAWKTENKIYEIAEEMGIDLNLFRVDVDWSGNGAQGGRIYASVMANQKITVSDFSTLSREVQKQHSEVVFNLVRTQYGDAEQFSNWLNFYGEIYLHRISRKNDFGKYTLYKITTNGDGITKVDNLP